MGSRFPISMSIALWNGYFRSRRIQLAETNVPTSKMSNLEIDQLQKSNRILEQTVQHHRQAFESINDDFVQYQH